MCGIAGIINFNNQKSILTPHLTQMASQMQKRGPDDEGFLLVDIENDLVEPFWGNDTPMESQIESLRFNPKNHIKESLNLKANVGFAHRRLTILDLSFNGHQPMCDDHGKFWIIFNGEIYNCREIAEELKELGYTFYGHSDTEILLYAYMEWKENCLKKLNGMFAFAIYDHNVREVFLARDRVGIKPFYYTIQNNQLIFASDIKTIIASGLYQPEICWEGLWHNLSLSIAPRPMTVFNGVSSLEHSHWMRVNVMSGKISKGQYWQIPVGTQDFTMSENQAAELLEHELTKSIKYRLIADVEVGTFMSGGIDSTLVSALASKSHNGIKTFTLGFQDIPQIDELSQAQETAKMHRMEHIVKIVKAIDILDHLDEMVLGYEEPFSSLAPNYVISQLVWENKIKVVLNGLGGDELFAGYPWYSWLRLWKKVKYFDFILKLLPDSSDSKWLMLRKLSNAKKIDQFYASSHFTLNEDEKSRLFNVNRKFDTLNILRQLYQQTPKQFTDDIEALSYFDLMFYIGSHHVYRVDQFTMMFSLEARLPFLDHQLIEAAFKIPSKYKIRKESRKYILKRVAEKYIAPSCLKMKKIGFTLPVNYWMMNELRILTEDALSSLKKREIFNSTEIDHIYKKFINQKNVSYKKVWHLVMFELWLRKFIDVK